MLRQFACPLISNSKALFSQTTLIYTQRAIINTTLYILALTSISMTHNNHQVTRFFFLECPFPIVDSSPNIVLVIQSFQSLALSITSTI